MAEQTWYAVHLATVDGEDFYEVVRDLDSLVTFVRVNGRELGQLRVSAVDRSILAENRILETFGRDSADAE